jgi:hypothetical protein
MPKQWVERLQDKGLLDRDGKIPKDHPFRLQRLVKLAFEEMVRKYGRMPKRCMRTIYIPMIDDDENYKRACDESFQNPLWDFLFAWTLIEFAENGAKEVKERIVEV